MKEKFKSNYIKYLKSALIVIGILVIIVIGFVTVDYIRLRSEKIEVNTDINKYNEYIGIDAKEEYQNKWDMDETIFPTKLDSDINVIDYKMVYYNPWDAQYLSYLVVDYNDEGYKVEVERLKAYNSTDYIGYYSVTGFSKYDLLAMYADSYQGFIYALTDNENRIIYVELIFCNYYYDIDYKEYINEEYLPDGFDATLDNPYQKIKMKER